MGEMPVVKMTGAWFSPRWVQWNFCFYVKGNWALFVEKNTLREVKLEVTSKTLVGFLLPVAGWKFICSNGKANCTGSMKFLPWPIGPTQVCFAILHSLLQLEVPVQCAALHPDSCLHIRSMPLAHLSAKALQSQFCTDQTMTPCKQDQSI